MDNLKQKFEDFALAQDYEFSTENNGHWFMRYGYLGMEKQRFGEVKKWVAGVDYWPMKGRFVVNWNFEKPLFLTDWDSLHRALVAWDTAIENITNKSQER